MTREKCWRAHWKVWRTKIADDGKTVVVCPFCGLVASGQLQWADRPFANVMVD